mmetsp:Transcript_71865/g.199435  ORF Transcript_71865/g.199435 Transcript_71865/m.199435 type:complete len:652 (+) Transcript_71865:129-2084(+)
MEAFATMAETLTKTVIQARAEMMCAAIAIGLHVLLFSKKFNIRRLLKKAPSTATKQVSSSCVRLSPKVDVASGRLDSALAVLQRCPEKSIVNYTALLELCESSGDVAAMDRVMAHAVASGVASSLFYARVVRAHLKHSGLAKARRIVSDMIAAGIQPSVVTFNEILDASGKVDSQATWSVIDQMVACGVKPNAFTCSTVLKKAQATSGDAYMVRALALVDSIDEIDDVLLSSMIEGCVRMRRLDLLSRIMKRQDGPNPVHVQSSHAFGSIIRAYGMLHNTSGVWAAWRDLQARQIPPTSITLGCMTEALASNDDPEGGYQLIHELGADPQTRPLVNAVTYCSVLKGFSHQKRFDRVWSIYQEMMQEGMQLTIVTYNTLLDACARCNEMGRVSKLLEDMVGQGIQPNLISYSAIIKGYCYTGRLEQALKVLDEMRSGTTIRPDEHTYNTLINGCAREGLYDKGVALLEEMCEGGISPTNFTLTVLVKLAGRSRRLESAFELCEQMSQKYSIRLNVHVYDALVQACCQQRDIRRAIEVTRRMVQEGIRTDVRTHTLLLQACVQCGAGGDAAGILRAACGLRGAHPDLKGLPENLLRPSGCLPDSLLMEVLQGIARLDDDVARRVLSDLQQLRGSRLSFPAIFTKAPQRELCRR